jgi:cell division ATPase FtsA
MEPAALARVLLPKEEGASAILDVGARGTTFACFGEDGGLELSVSISTGGNALSDALIDHAGVGEEEAHRLKSEEGFRLDAPGGGRTLLVLQEGAQSIVREVNQALAYYEGTYGKKIARIVLAGGSSLIPLFDRYLSANLGHPVALGDPSRRLSLPSAVQGAIPTIQLAPVFGLALRAEGRIPENDGINLLHGWEGERWAEREAKIIGRWKSVAIPLFSASALLLAYVLYAYLYAPHVRLREEASSRVAPFLDIDDRHRESAIPIAQEEGATTTVAESDPVAGGSVGDESGDATTTSVVRVGETPTGWLNVRSGPGVTFDVLTRVVPGDRLSLLAREGEWAEVMLPDGESGWVSGEYIVDDHDE